MKEINALNFPETVRYTEDHEWARQEGDIVRVGISDYAQDQLGDIVFVELPRVGDILKKGNEFGTVESVKAVSELYMPVGGEVVSLNTALANAPELVNTDPYQDGWMIEVRPDNPKEIDALMSRDTYLDMLKGMA